MVMFMAVTVVAESVLADTSEDMANLTTMLTTLLLAIIPLIIIMSVFTYVLTKIRFGPK